MTDLARCIADRGLRHLLFSFTDLFGVQRAKLVPAAAVAELAASGAGFAGFAAWLDLTPADPDVLALRRRPSIGGVEGALRPQLSIVRCRALTPHLRQSQHRHPIVYSPNVGRRALPLRPPLLEAPGERS